VAEVEASGYRFGYTPRTAEQPGFRVAIFEPNISVVKSSSVPMLICDGAYRIDPNAVTSMQVLNTLHLKDHATMLYMANSLDIVRQHKAIFHGRHDFAGFMVQFADAVVSHQWQNDQNYSYLDALYGNYPLVHNSPWLRDAGYYYPDFDIAAGTDSCCRRCAGTMRSWTTTAPAASACSMRSIRSIRRTSMATRSGCCTWWAATPHSVPMA
jgi:hypothetical protein